MYLEHFGLKELPFALTPNTAFFYADAGHREALNVLLVALRGGEGFVKVTGEVGTGKTLLCRELLRRLPEEYVTAYIPNPQLSPLGLQLTVAEELGADAGRGARCLRLARRLLNARSASLDPHQVVKRLERKIIELRARGKRAVLLIDEAQAFEPATLETLRLLTNLETERFKLLQIVLFAQPELDDMLVLPGLRQLRQRITFSHRLHPLDLRGLAGYVEFRLRTAGCVRSDLFSRSALRLLLRSSGGIPRLVNILAHKALMAAFGWGDRRIGPRHLRRAIADTDSARPLRRSPLGLRARDVTLASAIALWLPPGAAS